MTRRIRACLLIAAAIGATPAAANPQGKGPTARVQTAAERQATALEPLTAQAVALGDAGRMKDMLAVTRQKQRIQPDNLSAIVLQARLAALAGNVQLAHDLLFAVRDRLESAPGAMLLFGSVEYQLNNYGAAAVALGRLVSTQPDNLFARRLFGAVQWRNGDPDSAVQTLKPLVGTLMADHDMLAILAASFQKTGDAKSAAAVKALAAKPSPQELTRVLAAADRAMRAGQWTTAIPIYEKLRSRIGDGSSLVLNNLAWCYYQAGQSSKALAPAAAAYRRDARNASIVDTYGWILFAQHHYPEAQKALARAVALAPSRPTPRWHLAQAYAAAGDKDRAKAELAPLLNTPGFDQKSEAQALLRSL